MKTIRRKIGTVTVESRVFTKAELAKVDPKDRKFIRQMSGLADEMIEERLSVNKTQPQKKGQHR